MAAKLAVVALCFLLASPRAGAAIIGTSGQVVVVSPPASAANGDYESNTEIRAFAERQDIVLNTDVAVDITNAGTSPSGAGTNLSPGTIPTGTLIRSYLLHADVVGAPTVENAVALAGSATFDANVLGIIVLSDGLNSTNTYPGLSSVNYAFNSQRGLEINPAGGGTSDVIMLSADRRTVTVSLRGGPNVDDLRVITAPEPGTAGLIGVAAVGFLVRTRGRACRA
jgi:hypothetical protein